jgi:hypothetical protein
MAHVVVSYVRQNRYAVDKLAKESTSRGDSEPELNTARPHALIAATVFATTTSVSVAALILCVASSCTNWRV